MSNTVRVGIVDDHPLMLEGIAETLRSIDGFVIVGRGSSLSDALVIARDQQPEIMLLDVSMPGGGIEAARQLTKNYPAIKLMMLTVSERPDHVTAALELGARGYLLKGASSVELRDCLRTVLDGKHYITPELAMRMLVTRQKTAERNEIEPPSAFPNVFTVREKAVVELLARGKQNKEIAKTLGISEKTVKHYMTIVMEKLNVRNRVEAVLILTQSNIVGSELPNDAVNPSKSKADIWRQSVKAPKRAS